MSIMNPRIQDYGPRQPNQALGAVPSPIDREQLCWDDYWMLALLPVVGEAVAPFKDQAPNPVGMCLASMRAVFWYCWNNRWPCCGEDDLGDSCFERAEAMASVLFETDVIDKVKETLIPELQAQGLPRGNCPGAPSRAAAPRPPTRPIAAPTPPPSPASMRQAALRRMSTRGFRG